MENLGSIERSAELQPLRNEHIDGLLFVERIRKGLKNHTGIDELVKYVRWFWKNHIRPHFFQEEQILLRYLPVGHPLRIKIKEDHTEILEIMHVIDREVELFDLINLARFVESHIQWEERIFFPYYEENLTAAQLATIKKELEENPVKCNIAWTNEFWLTS